jgi:Ctr copper transporter family
MARQALQQHQQRVQDLYLHLCRSDVTDLLAAPPTPPPRRARQRLSARRHQFCLELRADASFDGIQHVSPLLCRSDVTDPLAPSLDAPAHTTATLATVPERAMSATRGGAAHALYGVNVATSYMLMLAVMTFNVGIFVATCTGAPPTHRVVALLARLPQKCYGADLATTCYGADLATSYMLMLAVMPFTVDIFAATCTGPPQPKQCAIAMSSACERTAYASPCATCNRACLLVELFDCRHGGWALVFSWRGEGRRSRRALRRLLPPARAAPAPAAAPRRAAAVSQRRASQSMSQCGSSSRCRCSSACAGACETYSGFEVATASEAGWQGALHVVAKLPQSQHAGATRPG